MPEPEYYNVSEAEAEVLIDRRLKEVFPDFYQELGPEKEAGDSVEKILSDLFQAGGTPKA